MANNIKNIIKAYGDTDVIHDMLQCIKGNVRNKKQHIDFRKILPLPATLNIEESSRKDEAVLYYLQEKEPDTRSVLYRLGRIASYNVSKYGYETSYRWCKKNWGSKCNAYGTSEENGNITFLTAWSPVIPIISKLSMMFPTLHFLYQWADEDYGYNCGETTFVAGREKDVYTPDSGSDDAIEFAESIWNQ